MSVHLIFGAGAVGQILARELVARGETVRLVSRSGRTVPGAQGLRGDVLRPGVARALAHGADVVYQVLGAPYAAWAERFPAMQDAVIDAAAHVDATLVTFENVYLYGDTKGDAMTEASEVAPTTRKGRVRAAMTRALLEAHDAGRVRTVIGRASDYFGPGAGPQSMLGDRVVPAALRGATASVVGSLDEPHSYAFLPDIARALAALAVAPQTHGKAWHLPHAPAETMRQLLTRVYGESGHPVKVSSAPPAVLRLMGWFDRNLRELDEMMYQYEQPFVVDDRAIRTTLGLEPTTLDVAIASTVASYRDARRVAA